MAFTLDLPDRQMSAVAADLHDSMSQHQAHLADLVLNMRRAGVDESLVKTSIRVILSSYEAGLGDTVARIRGVTSNV